MASRANPTGLALTDKEKERLAYARRLEGHGIAKLAVSDIWHALTHSPLVEYAWQLVALSDKSVKAYTELRKGRLSPEQHKTLRERELKLDDEADALTNEHKLAQEADQDLAEVDKLLDALRTVALNADDEARLAERNTARAGVASEVPSELSELYARAQAVDRKSRRCVYAWGATHSPQLLAEISPSHDLLGPRAAGVRRDLLEHGRVGSSSLRSVQHAEELALGKGSSGNGELRRGLIYFGRKY